MSLAYINVFVYYSWEQWQNNLINLETYLEPSQLSNVECFAKIVNG